MKVRTFTKKDVATEIANRLDATFLDSLTFTDELFLVLRADFRKLNPPKPPPIITI